MDYAKESLKKHYEWGGKIEVISKVPVATSDDLSLAYTPGVAQPCLEIERKLKEKCDNPIFHDDQHGTAVITLAGLVSEEELSADYIIPAAFDRRVGPAVAAAVADAARRTGVARI